jgi:hypothetical protein
VALSQFCGEQIRELYLAYFALDIGIAHSGVEIVLESVFAEQENKKLLRQI